jgi:hypothetical protein
VPGATRRVPFKTCETVETETPALRATSAIVATAPSPRMDFRWEIQVWVIMAEETVCAIVFTAIAALLAHASRA